MIIYSGFGFLVVVIIFGCSLAMNYAFNAWAGADYYTTHKWPLAISLLISAVICWVLGIALRNLKSRVVIDKANGKEMTLYRNRHRLFFIPMHLWGPILAAIAVITFAWDADNPLRSHSFFSGMNARTASRAPLAATVSGSNAASIAASQQAAVQKYPQLGVAGSKFNSAFVSRYKVYQQTNPQYFNDPAWPMKLASEIAMAGK